MTSLTDFPLTTLEGTPLPAAALTGRVVLLVNVASLCGFTPQYRALEQLHRDYREAGLVVLGFPCNQFRRQEPGDARAIAEFCHRHFAISFPLLEKGDVKGPGVHPLYAWVSRARPGLLGQSIKWNFTKFLFDRRGQPVARYAPFTAPDRLRPRIEALLRTHEVE